MSLTTSFGTSSELSLSGSEHFRRHQMLPRLEELHWSCNIPSVQNVSTSLSTLPTSSNRSRDFLMSRGRPLMKGHALSSVNPRML
ncbi:hypothetical protein KIN20_003116 [Parelaphostrongylus tenuis]|uniref:Uncharacterized protein n=1 Tax=Parelaphostrongylus tenuis TaxID=148309 RepID=A0AAD5LZM6_PARTN|nr:hypothetical protein KIN20_003116 [Parelaphostrongylus tenuis]